MTHQRLAMAATTVQLLRVFFFPITRTSQKAIMIDGNTARIETLLRDVRNGRTNEIAASEIDSHIRFHLWSASSFFPGTYLSVVAVV